MPQPGVLGVVLAGGRSRRFGGPKALFSVGGRAMAEWALLALKPHTSHQVAVTHDPQVASALGIPCRPDQIPGLGPLGGLHTALEWAGELGLERIFLLACDLPLVSADLVGQILEDWPPHLPASVPVSPGPLGFEPLCAGYSVVGLPAAERVAQSSDRSMARLLEEMGAEPVRLDPQRLNPQRLDPQRLNPQRLNPQRLNRRWTKEDLTLAFTNVNTRDEARRAEGLLRRWEDG